MYSIIESIDFEIKRENLKKMELKRLYIDWLNVNHPKINTVNTYFTDAIFIANNPKLKLNLLDILKNFDKGLEKYNDALICYFEDKDYPTKIAAQKAKDYIYKLILFKKFLDAYELRKIT